MHVFMRQNVANLLIESVATIILRGMYTQSYYLTVLKEELVERQKKNPSYSLRSYADYLGIHPGTLSAVLNGKRTLPLSAADRVADRLGLSPRRKIHFLKNLATEKARFKYLSEEEKEKQVILDEANYKVIAQWEHYAILTLIETANFNPDNGWIAQRLGVSVNQIEVAMERLLRSGLLVKTEDGNYKKTFSKLKTSEDVISPALQRAHLEELDLGKEKIEKIDVLQRDFSSITIAVNPKNLEKAKTAIYEFRQKMRSILEEGEKEEVYQLCIQLYPLTTIGGKIQ